MSLRLKKHANDTNVTFEHNNSTSQSVYFEMASADGKSSSKQIYAVSHLNDYPIVTSTKSVKVYAFHADRASNLDSESSTVQKKDIFGRILQEINAYGVEVDYEYDSYGNLLSAIKYSADSDDYIILGVNSYGSGDYVKTSRNALSTVDLTYNTDHGVVAQTKQSNFSGTTPVTTKYTYDNFYENTIGIEETGLITKENKLTYQFGRVRTMEDNIAKFGVRYDLGTDTVVYSSFTDNLERTILVQTAKAYNTIQGCSETTSKYFNNIGAYYESGYIPPNPTHTSMSYADKYGRIKKRCESNLEENTEISYQEDFSTEWRGESASAAKVKVVFDGAENRLYNYKYGYNNELVSWNCGSVGADGSTSNHLSIQQISGVETKYTFDNNERYKTSVEYDKTCTIEPRIAKTSIIYDNEFDNDDDFEENMFQNDKIVDCCTWEYKYDGLGRVDKKTTKYILNIGDETVSSMPAVYSYKYLDGCYKNAEGKKSATNIIESINYTRTFGVYINWGDLMSIQMNYSHDKNGRINQIFEEGSTDGATTGYNYSYVRDYEYDYNGKISKEILDVDNNIFETVFNYDNLGRLTSTSGYRTEIFEYYPDYKTSVNAGKLKTKIYSIPQGWEIRDYEYDNYGNRNKEYSNNSLYREYEYERGNVLSKINPGSSNEMVFKYNHQGVRFEKNYYGKTTKYYNDGSKILGEDRIDTTGNIIKIRYFYDAQGICGSCINYGDKTKYYAYVKNAFGDVIMIEDYQGSPLLRFEYDSRGRCVVKGFNRQAKWNEFLDAEESLLAELSPFRWRSHYRDYETGFYYVNGNYYDEQSGIFINAFSTKYSVDNPLDMAYNEFNIYTFLHLCVDVTYDPLANKPWWEYIWNVAANAINDIGGYLSKLLADFVKPAVDWWNNLDPGWKICVAIAVVVVLAVIAYFTRSTAVAEIFKRAAITSTVTGTVNFVCDGFALEASGIDFEAAANGAVLGVITGAVGGAISGAASNVGKGLSKIRYKLVQGGINAGIAAGTEAVSGIISGDFSVTDTISASIFGFIGGYKGAKDVKLGKAIIDQMKLSLAESVIGEILSEFKI